MEGQQECTNFDSIILVGDSRVESLISSFTWPHASTKLFTNSCKDTNIDDIINMMEEELHKFDKSGILMIMLGIHGDIMMMIDQKQTKITSILEDLVKKISSITERFKNFNPCGKFVWCLPSVPDFKRYNNNTCKKYAPYKEKDQDIDLVRKYFQTVKKLKQLWGEIMPVGSQVLVDLNFLGLAASSIANPQKTFAKFEDKEKLPSFVAAQTTDGFHLSQKMSVEFWKYVLKCISHSSIFINLEKTDTIEKNILVKDMITTPGRRASCRVKLKYTTSTKEESISEVESPFKMEHTTPTKEESVSEVETSFKRENTIPTKEESVSEVETPFKREQDLHSHSNFGTIDIEKTNNMLKCDSTVDKIISAVDISNNQCKNVNLKEVSKKDECCNESKKVSQVEGSKDDKQLDIHNNLNSKSELSGQSEEINQKLKKGKQIDILEKQELVELLEESEEEELIYEDILDKLNEGKENDNLKKEKEELNEDYSDKFFSVDELDDKFFMEVCETETTPTNNSIAMDSVSQMYELEFKGHHQTSSNIMNVKTINSEKDEDNSRQGSIHEGKVGKTKEASAIEENLIIASFEADHLIQSNKVKEIVKMQKGRIQSSIVIVTDERENFDVNFVGFNIARVSVIKIPGLKMSDAFFRVKLHHNFGRGTIFIFCCGTHDLVQSHSAPDCLEFLCPSPQTMLNLPFPIIDGVHYLVDAALNLNIDILLATENDVAIFCGLIPVHILDYNDFAARNRPCYSTHPIRHLPNINSNSFKHYKSSVIFYNKFIKYHAAMLGFCSWDLESEHVYLCKKQRRQVLLENRYNLCPKEGIRRANCAKLLCTKLLQTIVSNNFVKGMESHSAEYYSALAEIEGNDDLQNEIAKFHDTADRIAKQKMRMQNNIVIVTDDRDDFNIDYSGLEGKVSVLKKIGLNFGNAFSTVQMHPNFGKGTIFVFSCGTHDFLNSVILKDCIQAGCPTPQTLLIFNEAAVRGPNYLIKKALRLNNNILQATQNDIALFCGVTPVRVLPYNEFTIANRPCLMYHPGVSIPYTESMDYKKFLQSIASFASFIKYHAKSLGCLPWNMEQTYYSRNMVLLPNCYNICPEEQIRRAQKAKKLCAELLLHSVSNAKSQVNKGVPGSNDKVEPKHKLDDVNQYIKFESHIFKDLSGDGKKLQEVEKMQEGRIQNNIVIVTDDRENFEENFVNFDSKVGIITIPNLELGEAISHVKKHPKFGKGTIFVFSCGIHDLLQLNKAQECLPNCLSPQSLFSIKNLRVDDTHYLVKKALELNLEILQTTENDIALFCGLIPIDVYNFNNFIVKNHNCGNFHKEILIPNIDVLVNKHCQEIISMFNSFIKYHTEKLSFSPWDLELSYFARNGNGILLPNCYNFTPAEAANRSDQAKLLCTELLIHFSNKCESSEQLEKSSMKQLVMIKDEPALKLKEDVKAEVTVDNKKLSSANKEQELNLIKIRYQDQFEKIKSMQKDRWQEFIVIVTDDRDDFVAEADIFDSKVSFLKIPALQLDNAFTYIRTHPNFGKGTSFVFICGTYDIVNTVFAEDCILFQCLTPQTMFTLPMSNEKDPLYLINRALQLNIDILNSTPNDIVLFSGLIPVQINDYNKYAADQRPCKKNHALMQFPVMSLSNLSYYEKCLCNYNIFTNCHAQELRYNPWNLHEQYFSEAKTNIFRENFYHFSTEEQQQRVRRAKVLSTVMLLSYQRFKSKSKLKSSVHTVNTSVFEANNPSIHAPTSSTVSAPFVPAGQVLPQPSLGKFVAPVFPMILQSSGSASIYAEPDIMPSLPAMSSCSSFQRIVPVPAKFEESKEYLEKSNSHKPSNYDRIAIVADRRDAPYINHLANIPEVVIYVDFEFKVDYLQDFLLRMKDYLPPKTLYLLVVGIHAITKSVPAFVCRQGNCAMALELLEPLTYNGFDSFIQTQIQIMYNAISQAKLSLPSESIIEILPPLPASLISLNNSHENLHQYKYHFPEYLLAQSMDVIEALFSIWVDQISTYTKPVLAKYIEKYPYIENKLSYLRKLEVMNCGTDDKPSYNQWKDVVSSIIDAALSLSTPPEVDKSKSHSVPTSTLEGTALPVNKRDEISLQNLERDLNSAIRFSKNILNAECIIPIHKFNTRPMFQNVYVVKHVSQQVSMENSNLKKPFSDCNYNSVTIYHNFSNYGDDDVQSLLNKLGQYPKRSLCCLVFDISVIAAKQTISLSCSKQHCPEAVFENALEVKVSNGHSAMKELEKLVESKIGTIASFIRKLNKKISVIVLPLLPTKNYCDYGSSVEQHKTVHSIREAGAYIVCGSGELWRKATQVLINSWNKFMEKNNREYNFYDYSRIYKERGRATFPIKSKPSSFVQQWREPDVWGAFVETFLLSMVSYTKQISSDIEYALMPDKMHIRIVNISPSIPSEFLTELFKDIEKDSTIEFENGECRVKKMKMHKALLLIRKLNEFRFGGSQLQASLVTHSKKDYADYKINLVQDLYISSIFEKVYLKWRLQIIENMTKEINAVHDISSIKVYPCTKKNECRGYQICPYYHSSFDCRRNPLLYQYSTVTCFHKKLDDDTCSFTPEECKYSRNIFEVEFNEVVYQKSVCAFKIPSELCNKRKLCSKAHLDSPELLFTSHWKDTVVSGADLTIKYFTGSIRSIMKFEKTCNFRILLISPSIELLDVAASVSKNLLKTFKLEICTLGMDPHIPGDCKVLLGDPITFSKLDAEIFREMKGVIIVDDARRIIENDTHKAALQKVFQMVHSLSFGVTYCKVFVYFGDDKSIYRMRTLLENTFKVKLQISLGDGNSSKAKRLSMEIDETKQSRKSNSSRSSRSIDHKSRSRTLSLSDSSSSSSVESIDSSDDKRLTSKSYKHSRWSSPSSGTQNKRSRSKSFSNSSTSICKKRRSADVVSPIDSRSEKEHYFSDNQEDIRKYFGESLFQEYIETLEKLRSTFEKEFSIFRDVPELCPHYEQCYDNFNNIYSKQHKNKGDEHRDELWNIYWLSQFEEFKAESWLTKQQKIFQEFKEKILSKSLSMSKPSVSYPGHSRDPERKVEYSASQDHKFNEKGLGKSTSVNPPVSYPGHSKDPERKVGHSAAQDHKLKEKGFGKSPSVNPPSVSYPGHSRDPERKVEYSDTRDHKFKEKGLGKSPENRPSVSYLGHSRDPERKVEYSATRDQVLVKQKNCGEVEKEKFSDHKKTSSTSSIDNSSRSKEKGFFGFNEALSMLEKLSEAVGFLGPSVSAMVASSREFGLNSIDAYNVFTNEENAMVINMVLEKIKTLRLSASGSKLLLYEKAIDWIPKLLEEAKKGPKETQKEESLPIDVAAIAKVTQGKSSEFTLKLIKTALAYEGVTDPSKEMVNDLFLQVCKIHFALSMDD